MADFYKENKELFDEIKDLVFSCEEYAYVFTGHREDELKKELVNLRTSLDKIGEIIDYNFYI